MLVATAANAAIAIVKAAAGILTGSAGLLAEAAHSIPDTTNQVLLLTSLELGRRPADEAHPFGHGKDRFFWSFLAAVVIFLAGTVFSIGQGVLELVRRQQEGSFVKSGCTSSPATWLGTQPRRSSWARSSSSSRSRSAATTGRC